MDYPHYLRAKASIDERSLNRYVYTTFLQALKPLRKTSQYLSMLEMGGGIGNMLIRLLQEDLTGTYNYTFLDSSPDNSRAAFENVVAASHDRFEIAGQDLESGLILRTREAKWYIRFRQADVLEFIKCEDADPYQIVIGQAFLDLFDLDDLLAGLCGCIAPGGLLYVPITYDGLTQFLPPDGLDAAIMAAYHRSMPTTANGTGGATCGRDTLAALTRQGHHILAAGGSDWVVHAGPDGCYPDEEKHFLACILGFIESELIDAAEPPEGWQQWLARRTGALEHGNLIYLTHQLDILARVAAG